MDGCAVSAGAIGKICYSLKKIYRGLAISVDMLISSGQEHPHRFSCEAPRTLINRPLGSLINSTWRSC